ncbi:MAG: ribonuclease H-like domain-containing protein [Acidobacteriota bacterium]
MSTHATVIDIETVPQPLSAFPERFHDKLVDWFQPPRREGDVEPSGQAAAEGRFNLWGGTGRVIVIGMHNPDSGQSRILASDDERDLLKEFWELVKPFDLQITFNGKLFDFPFLQLRSAILQVKPSVRLDCRRYSRHPHLDLRELLTNFYAQKFGTLDFFCELFGIASPKTALSGSQVAAAYREGRLQEIADYCRADVTATAELYLKTQGYY